MRKRCGVFGNNAPLWRSMDATFQTQYLRGSSADSRPNGRISTISESAASASGGFVDLDQVQSEIAADVASDATRRSLAVLAKGGFNRPDENFPSGTSVELYRVTAHDGSFAGGIRAVGQGDATWRCQAKTSTPRSSSMFARRRSTPRSELMPLAHRPVPTSVSGDRIPVDAAADGLLPGRRLIIRGSRASDKQAVVVQATLVAAHTVDDQRAAARDHAAARRCAEPRQRGRITPMSRRPRMAKR